MNLSEFFPISFYVLLGLYAVLLIVFSIKNKKALKITNIVFLSLLLIHTVLRLILLGIKIKDYELLNAYGIYILSAILVVGIILLCVFFGKDEEKISNTKAISYGGICTALAFALSYIKIEFLGGSITLASALPIIVYAYIFGARKGVFVGIIFGVLQFIQKPTIYQFMQVLLDYPIAFGGIGLAGIAKNIKVKPIFQFIIGASIGLFVRYISHVISGYFVFFIYAPEGWNPLWYSIVFNMNVLVDLAIVLVLGSIIFASKTFVNKLKSIR